MKQIIKYLIVALIFLIIGGLTVFFIDRHTALLNHDPHLIPVKKEVLTELSKVAPETKTEKDDSKTEKKSPESHNTAESDKAPKAKTEGKKGAKEVTQKKEEADEENESADYLRSLWPVKKRKAANLSGEQKGPLYLNGTSPYGPPHLYKEDLFDAADKLEVSGTPLPPTQPEPLKTLPPIRKKPIQKETTTASLYQIQIGQFSTLSKAQDAQRLMAEKGIQTTIFYTGQITMPDWYYVRLSEAFYKHQAYKIAETIAVREKLVPSVIPKSNDMKHLK